MATGGQEQVGYGLVKVGTLKLENTNNYPEYISIVFCQNKIVVVDINAWKVCIHRLHDGKFLATSGRLQSRPRDMCLMDAMTVCVIHDDGLINMMSIDATDMSHVFKTIRNLRLQGLLDEYHGVVRFKDNLVVSGIKQGTMYWCILSIDNGHVETIHQICKGDKSSIKTKDSIIYILCDAGWKSLNNGVFGFDILNPSQCKYTYQHQRLQWPRSIVINEDGNIFVCNGYPDSCIHQLTASCQLVSIFTQGIPLDLIAIFWDHGCLYVACYRKSDITVFQPVYQGGDKASEIQMSNERKQSIIEVTSIDIGQGNVDRGQSRRERTMPSAVPIPEDTEDRQVIPAEILNMDTKSIVIYKKALRNGKEKVYNIRVMVVGQFGVGKTTLTKRLLGRDVKISERQSTEGIDIHTDCCKVSLETGEWIMQEKTADEYFRLQRLINLLGIQELVSSAEKASKSERGDHFSDDNHADTSVPRVHPKQDKKTDRKPLLPPRKQTQPSIRKVDKRHSKVQSDQNKSTVNMPTREGVSRERDKKKDARTEFYPYLAYRNVVRLRESIVTYATLGVWDFAGQYIFYTTHQTFLTSRAIYLLVIDLHQQVTDLIKDDQYFHDTKGIKRCKVHDVIEIWLNSIHTCETSPASGIPPVILVGTHVDKIPKKSQQKVIDEYFLKIRYMLGEKPAVLHLMDDIAIDNTQCDPRLEELKSKIFELASRQSHWGEEKPIRWRPLEQAMMTLKAGAKVVPLSLIEEINNSGFVTIRDRDELDLFLRFHHEIGTILHFNVEGLREKIVLDPQWLIDALKSLITAEEFIRKNPAIIKSWREFKSKGKLTQELIDGIWTKEKNPEFYDNKDYILLLMEKLNIIAKPMLYSEDGKESKVENYYLAPCMLNKKAPKEVICPKPHPEMESSSVLSYVFKEKFLPAPIFHRLLAACVAKWPISKDKKSENLIYCGCGVFDLDLHNRLIVSFREYVIFTQVTRFGTKERSLSLKQCIEVREFISMTLSKVIGGLGQSLQFELFVRCPKSDGYGVDCLTPVADLQKNVDVPCHFHEKKIRHMIISHEVLKFWFQEEQAKDPTEQKDYRALGLGASEKPQLYLPSGKKCHVFFSYASQDMQWVKDTVEKLEREHGFVCREYDRDNTPGTPLMVFAENSIRDAYKTVVVMTSEAFDSGFVKHEIEMALIQGFDEKRKCIVPVLLKDCKVPVRLRALNYVDARDPNQRDIWWPKLLAELHTQEVPESNQRTQHLSEETSTLVEQGDPKETSLDANVFKSDKGETQHCSTFRFEKVVSSLMHALEVSSQTDDHCRPREGIGAQKSNYHVNQTTSSDEEHTSPVCVTSSVEVSEVFHRLHAVSSAHQPNANGSSTNPVCGLSAYWNLSEVTELISDYVC